MRNTPPVIIIGMHRSGTTMLTKLLERMGLFVGDQKEANHESVFFLALNNWMLAQSNANWDCPDNFRFVNQDLTDYFDRVLYQQLEKRSAETYLSPLLASKYKSVFELDRPWGWKDPRNTLTFSQWLRIFPQIKVVHIVRNPLDVAESLRVREHSYLERMQDVLRQDPDNFDTGEVKLQRAPRLFHLDQGIRLWKDYVQAGLDAESLLPEGQVCRLRYEDFLASPEDVLSRLSAFCGLNVTESEMHDAIKGIDSSRRYSFLGKQELVEAFGQIKNDPLLSLLGYGELNSP